MSQCLAVDLVYHLFDVYVGYRLYIVFLFFFVLFCANKRVHKNLDRSFSRFVTINAFDIQTDGRTNSFLIDRPRLHSMIRYVMLTIVKLK